MRTETPFEKSNLKRVFLTGQHPHRSWTSADRRRRSWPSSSAARLARRPGRSEFYGRGPSTTEERRGVWVGTCLWLWKTESKWSAEVQITCCLQADVLLWRKQRIYCSSGWFIWHPDVHEHNSRRTSFTGGQHDNISVRTCLTTKRGYTLNNPNGFISVIPPKTFCLMRVAIKVRGGILRMSIDSSYMLQNIYTNLPNHSCGIIQPHPHVPNNHKSLKI